MNEEAFQQGNPRAQLKHAHCIFISNANHWPYHSWPFARSPIALYPVDDLQFFKLFPEQGKLLCTDSVSTMFPPNVRADVVGGSTVYQ